MTLLTETRFAYFHKPTQKWVKLVAHSLRNVTIYLQDDFSYDMCYLARNVIEEDLRIHSYFNNAPIAEYINEFELKEIIVKYEI